MKMTIMKKGFNYIHSSLKAGSMSHRVTEGCIDMKSVGTERAETGASVRKNGQGKASIPNRT